MLTQLLFWRTVISYKVLNKEYNKKKMSRTEWELYMKNEDYAITKPKYIDQKGKKRKYCNLGWSKDGIEFCVCVCFWPPVTDGVL